MRLWEQELGTTAAELFGREGQADPFGEAWGVIDRLAERREERGRGERLAACVGDRTGRVSDAIDCLRAGREPGSAPVGRGRRRRGRPGEALAGVLGEEAGELLAAELREDSVDFSRLPGP